MTNMQERDADVLAAMLDFCDRIVGIMERLGYNKEKYSEDYVFQDAIKMNVFQIGELSNQVSDECKEALPQIPWHQIYGTRNIIAHGYMKVSEDIIW